LYLAIINEAPLPLYLDPIIFYFIFNEVDRITIEDLDRHNHAIYEMVISITDSAPNEDLDNINGFSDWAEANNFQVLFYFLYFKFNTIIIFLFIETDI